MSQDDWVQLWDRAKDLERRVAEGKRAARADIAAQFPEVGKQPFGNLVRAAEAGRLRAVVAELVQVHQREIAAMELDARTCRERSEQLRLELAARDMRPWLDPRVEPIPPGPYPKLRQCSAFPLRQGCDHGESASARWRRCEFMEYDRSKSPFDSARWRCTATE